MKIVFLMTLMISIPAQAQSACTPQEFVTVTESQATVAISGGGYTPKCLKVKSGTAVTIQASPRHPLQGVQVAGNPTNPFVRGTEATRSETHSLVEPGRYAYFCTHHGDSQGGGMAGEILVE